MSCARKKIKVTKIFSLILVSFQSTQRHPVLTLSTAACILECACWYLLHLSSVKKFCAPEYSALTPGVELTWPEHLVEI